jgi:C-terminal processing protease CtpA/Prc
VGKGVQPDVSAPRTVQDFLAGRDAALEAGLTELKKTIAEARGH